MTRNLHAWLPLVALLVGCAPPDMKGAFYQVDVSVASGPGEVESAFAKFVKNADDTLRVAIPRATDTVLAEAILDKWTSGVDVEVVTDFDRADDPGIAMLIEGGVPVTLADDGVTYFDFNVNTNITFESEKTIMSNSWVIADRTQALLADRAGDAKTGEAVLIELGGEWLIEDLATEHNQLFGGTDATSTTAFDGLAKSIADSKYRYPTQGDIDIEMYFGPQERLIKRCIDAIYAARGSVEVLTNEMTDAGLAKALQEKASWGFPVRAVVGPDFTTAGNRQARIFTDETPDVVKRQFTAAEDAPTVVLVDFEPGIDGNRYDTRVFVITHDIYTTSRLEGANPAGEGLNGPVTDQLIDGTLFVIVDYDEPSKSTQALHDLWQRHFDAAGSL